MCHSGLNCTLAVLGMSGLFWGCGPQRPATVPISGTVTLDGKPLPAGTIVLEARGARPAQGRVVDGRIIDVFTYAPGDGAVVGKHKVAIQSPAATDAPASVAADPGKASLSTMTTASAKPEVPLRYANPATSGLEASVEPDMPPLSFQLRSE